MTHHLTPLTYSEALPTWTFCASGSFIVVLIVCATILRWRSRPPRVIVETTDTNSPSGAAVRTRQVDEE